MTRRILKRYDEDVPKTPAFFKDAKCKGMDPEFFFPEKGAIAAPKKICANCPVQLDCLDYAVENRIEFGVWGGVSQRQRLRLYKTRDYSEFIPRQCKAEACRGMFIAPPGQETCSSKCIGVLRFERISKEKQHGSIT